jgi:hypothetical protein
MPPSHDGPLPDFCALFSEKGNQAIHSRIAWLREGHNLYGDFVIWGNAFTLILRFFRHEVAGKHRDFFQASELRSTSSVLAMTSCRGLSPSRKGQQAESLPHKEIVMTLDLGIILQIDKSKRARAVLPIRL